MNVEELLKDKREEILNIAAKHGARNIRVFGSVARGEAREDSDIDFLVEMEPGRSLLDHAGLIIDLEDLLGRKVDVVTNGGLNSYLKDHILAEARPLQNISGYIALTAGVTAKQKDNRVYFYQMQEAINRIERYTKGGKESFFESEQTQSAVIWNVGVISRAAKQVSVWLKDSHPEIPWHQMIYMYDKLVNDHFKVDVNSTWQLVERDVPLFKESVQILLQQLEQAP